MEQVACNKILEFMNNDTVILVALGLGFLVTLPLYIWFLRDWRKLNRENKNE